LDLFIPLGDAKPVAAPVWLGQPADIAHGRLGSQASLQITLDGGTADVGRLAQLTVVLQDSHIAGPARQYDVMTCPQSGVPLRVHFQPALIRDGYCYAPGDTKTCQPLRELPLFCRSPFMGQQL
jgi:hypothetical protein